MDRKKWKTISQEISCPECGTVVQRKQNNQRFCTRKCAVTYWGSRGNWPQVTKSCVVCNDEFVTPKKKTKERKTCSKFCADVATSVEQQIWTDEELVHLMLLNRGLGIQRFITILGGYGGSNRITLQDRVLHIIDYMKEEESLDLFSILSDPASLIEMRLDDWVAAGKPPLATKMVGGFGNRMTRKQYMVSRELRLKVEDPKEFDKYNRGTSRTVKVYPEFNWGPYKKRTRPKK